MAKILVVDDDPLMIRLMEFKLKQQGYTLVTASNGEEALSTARTEKPDLVILDALMPIMDGFEALRQFKDAPDLKSIPIMMLTIRGEENDIVHCLDLGAADYVVKPFSPPELLARIRKVLATEKTPSTPA